MRVYISSVHALLSVWRYVFPLTGVGVIGVVNVEEKFPVISIHVSVAMYFYVTRFHVL